MFIFYQAFFSALNQAKPPWIVIQFLDKLSFIRIFIPKTLCRIVCREKREMLSSSAKSQVAVDGFQEYPELQHQYFPLYILDDYGQVLPFLMRSLVDSLRVEGSTEAWRRKEI